MPLKRLMGVSISAGSQRADCCSVRGCGSQCDVIVTVPFTGGGRAGKLPRRATRFRPARQRNKKDAVLREDGVLNA